MICGIICQVGNPCMYPMAASSADVIAIIGTDSRLVLSQANQKGSFTTTGSAHSAAMAPDGIATSTQQTFSNTTGKPVLEFLVTCPASTGGNAGVSALLDSIAGADVFNLDVTAEAGGTFGIDLYHNSPFVMSYTVTGLATAPAKIAVAMDSGAGTYQLYLDDVPVTMLDDTMVTASDLYVQQYASEASGVTSIGQVYAIELVTDAAAIATTGLPSGSNDIDGTLI
jgi:hypothetical protein